MKELKGSDREALRSQAHSLKPLVQVGKGGVTEGVIFNVREAFDTHELIKVRFTEHKDEKLDLSSQIAEKNEEPSGWRDRQRRDLLSDAQRSGEEEGSSTLNSMMGRN